MQMLVMVLSCCCCFFCCLSVLEVIKGHYQHAAHAGLRLTSADFLLYFNSISRNKRHGYGSLGSSLSPLLFINGVLHSGSAIEPDSLKVIQHFCIRGQQMDFSLHCNKTKVRFFQTEWPWKEMKERWEDGVQGFVSAPHFCAALITQKGAAV